MGEIAFGNKLDTGAKNTAAGKNFKIRILVGSMQQHLVQLSLVIDRFHLLLLRRCQDLTTRYKDGTYFILNFVVQSTLLL